jgi:hypothetical protein
MFDHDILTAQNRHTALRQEANERQLAKLACAEQPRHTTITSRVLDRLGQTMVSWGWRLRARYGKIETAEARGSEA